MQDPTYDDDETPFVVMVPIPLWQWVAIRLVRAAVLAGAVAGLVMLGGVR
jgi:hypothetical protein